MGRPTKQGIDYFPLDTTHDPKIELFMASEGAEGYGILITLWQMIYRDQGYYIKYDEDLVLILRKHTLSTPEKIVSAIDNAIKRGLFFEPLSRQKILTSKGIQKRFFTAAKKKKEVIAEPKYLLIPVDSFQNVIDSSGNSIDVAGNATKEKEEEKEDINKEKISLLGTFKNVKLSEKEYEKIKEKFNGNSEEKINALSEYMSSRGKRYKSHYATILSWSRKEAKSSGGRQWR